MKSSAILAFALALPIGSALAADPVVPASDLSLLNGENLNKLASNKLASNKLATNKLAVNKLAANGIVANATGTDPGDATPLVRVRTVTLADGRVLIVTRPR